MAAGAGRGLLAVSLFSLASGALDLLGGEGSGQADIGDAPVLAGTLNNRDGPVEVSVTYGGQSGDQQLFDITLSTDDMGSPPLDAIDLAALATLQVDGRRPVPASRWTVGDVGHMAYHVEGRLAFPARVGGDAVLGPDSRDAELVLRDLGGVPERSLQWRQPGGSAE